MDGQKTKAEPLRVGARALLPDGYTGIVTDNNPVLGMTTLVRLGQGVDYSSAPSQGNLVTVATDKLRAVTNPADVVLVHPQTKHPRFLATNVGPTTIVVPITIGTPRAIYLNRAEIVSLEAMSRPLALLRLSGREDVIARAEVVGYRDVTIEVKGTTLHFEGWKGGDRHRTEVGMGPSMSTAEALSLLWHRVNALPNAIQQPHESVAALELKEARARLKAAEEEDAEARSILNRMGAPKGTLAQKIRSVGLSDEGKLKPLYDKLAELEEWDPSRANETVIEAACRLLDQYRAASLSDELEQIDKALSDVGEPVVKDETIAEAACRVIRKPRAEVDAIMLDAIKAPQSVLANGYCVKLPTFVAQHIGAEDGDGVVFWAHKTIDHAMVIVSNKTAAQKCGWDSPFEKTFPLGTLVRFDSPEGPETGIVVNHEVDRADGRDLLRLRLPGNRLGIVNPSIVRVAKAQRCPHFYGRHGLQCELEARHACDHWASVDDQQSEEWERDTDAEHEANRLWTSVYARMLPLVAKEAPDMAHKQATTWANQAVREFYNRPE
jgi:hypothetical protein